MIRQLAGKHSMHRRMVRQALASAVLEDQRHVERAQRNWVGPRTTSTKFC